MPANDRIKKNISENVPNIVVPPPGPKSRSWHERASKHMRGYSSQVKQFPVVWESGKGSTMTDVDGNTYIDFSAGIYHQLGCAKPYCCAKWWESCFL